MDHDHDGQVCRIATLRMLWDELGEDARDLRGWHHLDGNTLVEVRPVVDEANISLTRDQKTSFTLHEIPDPMEDDPSFRRDGRIGYVSRFWLWELFSLDDLERIPDDIGAIEEIEPPMVEGLLDAEFLPHPCVDLSRAAWLGRQWEEGQAPVALTRQFLLSLVTRLPLSFSWRLVSALKGLAIIESNGCVAPRIEARVQNDPEVAETYGEWAVATILSVCKELSTARNGLLW